MRKAVLPVVLLLLVTSICSAAGNYTSEGGNVSEITLNMTGRTLFWAAIVGWMNVSAHANPNYPISDQDVPSNTVYTNYPNGTYYLYPYGTYYNISMVVTRLGFRPTLENLSTPTAADFNTGGMFSNFTVFAPFNFTFMLDGPYNTFANPLTMMICRIGSLNISCPYVTLADDTRMAVLKYSNGTHDEPIFINLIESKQGFNGTYFDFEYMVPDQEFYYFYVYPEDCNITVYIDGVQTTIFPKTGVPYGTRFLVTYLDGTPISGARVKVTEENGRNILSPNLYPDRAFTGSGYSTADISGNALYALSPTRYNVPDSYNYSVYVEVISPAYCRKNLSIAVYHSLSPTYRTSLIDANYGSQVKTSVQNMNSLASTASKWIYARKMRNASVTVTTAGAVGAMPTLKAGAPNYMNITVTDLGTPVTANLTVGEKDGLIIFVPAQPGKDLYNNTGPFLSNETFMLIPTRYNNNANLTIFVEYNGTNIANLTYNIDTVLADPAPSEMDMDEYTNALIGSALQNINLVLSNIGKSISTV